MWIILTIWPLLVSSIGPFSSCCPGLRSAGACHSCHRTRMLTDPTALLLWGDDADHCATTKSCGLSFLANEYFLKGSGGKPFNWNCSDVYRNNNVSIIYDIIMCAMKTRALRENNFPWRVKAILKLFHAVVSRKDVNIKIPDNVRYFPKPLLLMSALHGYLVWYIHIFVSLSLWF